MNEQTISDNSNPYVAPTTTGATQPSPVRWRLRIVGISLLWFSVAAIGVLGRLTVLPMFEDFGITLPIITLIAVSRAAFIAALVVAVSILVVAIVAPENRVSRILLSCAMLLGIAILGSFVLALILPIVGMFDSLS